jgi:hypothetical protein
MSKAEISRLKSDHYDSTRWLRREIEFNTHARAELLGVFASNLANDDGQGAFLRKPVPIGSLDIETLVSMRLIEKQQPTKNSEQEARAKATKLGTFVGEHCQQLVDTDKSDGSIPVMDLTRLKILLDDSFSG